MVFNSLLNRNVTQCSLLVCVLFTVFTRDHKHQISRFQAVWCLTPQSTSMCIDLESLLTNSLSYEYTSYYYQLCSILKFLLYWYWFIHLCIILLFIEGIWHNCHNITDAFRWSCPHHLGRRRQRQLNRCWKKLASVMLYLWCFVTYCKWIDVHADKIRHLMVYIMEFTCGLCKL